MRLYKYSYLILGLALLLSSCTKDLAEINKNPNASEQAQPDYLLTAASKAASDTYWGTSNNMDATLLFVQHWAKIQYTDPDRYIYTNTAFQDLWTVGYSKVIVNLNQIIALGEEQENPNYKGVALVLRSWIFNVLTDSYGDIPYTQAGKIKEYLTPSYDKQKDVYFALLEDLKTAQGLLDPAGKAIAGDVIYSNNITSWKKFANSLRYRIALRIADKEPAKAREVIAEIGTAADAVIGSNTETAKFGYLDSPNQNPISNLFDTRDDYRISKAVTDKLRTLNDPRLSIYSSPTQTATADTYVGIPNGLLTGDASSLGFTRTSKPGTYFIAPRAPAVILSYAEILFDRAEAAARGFTTEDAAALYQQAIRASLTQYGVATGAADTYLANPTVAYDAVNYKKSIGEQKWIALFGQGLEAWAEWRRLDYPQLTPAVAGTLGGAFPVRYLYPGTEQSLNGTNYKAAVANQGADVLTTKLWFDAN